MEGAPVPSLYPPFPANLVIMNVVSQFTVYDSDLRAPRPWQQYVSLWTSLQERGRQERVGNPLLEARVGGGGVADSAQCQQLPILGIKHTGAQELQVEAVGAEEKSGRSLGPRRQQPSQSSCGCSVSFLSSHCSFSSAMVGDCCE